MEIERGKTTCNDDHEEISPVEQVRLTVLNTDDPTLPVWTFRMWFLGILSCALLSFLNTFFYYRTEPLVITMISVQVATLPLGRLMARVLPENKFRLGSREFSLNPGPFNMKEHVLISIFANAGAGFGGGAAYAVGIVDIIRAFYHRKISFLASWILVITTQVLGYGWAGVMRKYVVDPAHMWWPSSLVQVSLFRTLHEKDDSRGLSRAKFFLIALICSFSWYIFPGYLFPTLANISILCLAYPNSVKAQQIGSGMKGLGILSFTVDWSTVASYLGSPLVTPFFAILNICVGFLLVMYLMTPLAYWGFNLYNARTFPIFSSHLFDSHGQIYNVSAIVNKNFNIDLPEYEKQGHLSLSTFFAFTYGIGFAAVASTISHVALFNGSDIIRQYRASTGKIDIHTKLMRKYEDIPNYWFHLLVVASFLLSLFLCIFMNDQIQMPWWGLIFACALASVFTLPISIITATTNQTPGLNIITEYLIGIIYPGRPIANVTFKTYGYISMSQAVSFLNDFKLGHYMKIPPRSMFIVQLFGTILAGTINIAVAFWMLGSIENICQDEILPPDSPWMCPNDRVFYDASVIWGLVGPKRIFGSLGSYSALNWFFFGGFIGPFFVFALHKLLPNQKWIKLINLPVILGSTAMMPPATSLNYTSWIFVGTIFNFFVLRYRKNWWQKYNYVLSAALDAGLAFMGILLYFSLNVWGVGISWWGSEGEHCGLASCPTAKGVAVDGCPLH